MLDGLHEAVGGDELVEDILEDVFGVAAVGDVAADEVAQARLIVAEGIGDELILFV